MSYAGTRHCEALIKTTLLALFQIKIFILISISLHMQICSVIRTPPSGSYSIYIISSLMNRFCGYEPGTFLGRLLGQIAANDISPIKRWV